jgi:glycosyltransferase involved in cell wall biosynthesis
MRLALITFEPFWYDGEKYSTNSNFINFLLAFKTHFKEIVLLAHIRHTQKEKGKVLIDLSGIEVRPLPFHKNLFDMYWRLPFSLFTTLSKVKRAVEKSDVVFIDEQHIQSTLLYGLIKYSSRNIFFWILADIEKSFIFLDYSGMKRILAKILGKIHLWLNKAMIRRYPTFVVGEGIFYKYSNISKSIYKIHLSLVSNAHILSRTAVLQKHEHEEIHLLTVGRLTSVKGINYLIEALPWVIAKGNVPIRLTIVGIGRQEQKLQNMVEELNLSKQVAFAGYIPSRNELMNLYTNSDIFISSSLSEGFPRTFFEAMARGVPIISTNVGGIPDVIKNGKNGLLITPRNPLQIANAVVRLIKDVQLRAKLIENGLKTVKQYTLEAQIEKIMNIVFQNIERQT